MTDGTSYEPTTTPDPNDPNPFSTNEPVPADRPIDEPEETPTEEEV